MLLATSGLTLTIAVIAPVLTILQCVAQAMRIYRAGAKGVSLGTWILSAFVAEIWTSYGFVFHVPAELYANIPFLIVASIVIVVAARNQGVMRRVGMSCIGITALAMLCSLTGLSHHWRWILSTVAVMSAVVIYLPQMFVTLRTSNLTGVSVVSWALALVTGLSWALYGILIHQPPVALPAVVMVPSALVILIQVTRHRLRGRALAGSLAPIIE